MMKLSITLENRFLCSKSFKSVRQENFELITLLDLNEKNLYSFKILKYLGDCKSLPIFFPPFWIFLPPSYI